MVDCFPPVTFHFAVLIEGSDDPSEQWAFQEVSGLDSGHFVESLAEGGENRFAHQLPRQSRQSNIELKRGSGRASTPLFTWVKQTLEGDLAKPIQPKTLRVNLLNELGDAVLDWTVQNAFPVKWEVASLNSQQNELSIETIEFAYASIKRNS